MIMLGISLLAGIPLETGSEAFIVHVSTVNDPLTYRHRDWKGDGRNPRLIHRITAPWPFLTPT